MPEKDLKEIFSTQAPKGFFIQPDESDMLVQYLKSKGMRILGSIRIEQLVGGNMNLTLRVKWSDESIIVKQSRPWVEKYPHIPAPINRLETESRFYDLMARNLNVKPFFPKKLAYDSESNIMILEDFGNSNDFSFLYNSDTDNQLLNIDQLINILLGLHSTPIKEVPYTKNNFQMRVLNHHHIFEFPFLDNNDFDLDTIQPGLQNYSLSLKKDFSLKEKVNKIGEIYLSNTGDSLLHGDFYPGSWLYVDNGILVIDPEFSFVGHKEFDIAVLLAHLELANFSNDQLIEIVSSISAFSKMNIRLVECFKSIEIIRRLIGVAQLPLLLSLEKKIELIEKSKYIINHSF